MSGLSISKAWEESRAVLAHDGRLIAAVALALVALPTAITGLISPEGVSTASAPAWTDAVVLVASLAALAGQLALIRLALGPSITVGAAIEHGVRRMPVYVLSAVLIVLGMMVLAVPFAVVLSLLGVPLGAKAMPATPEVITAMLLFLALVIFVAVRLLVSGPVASGEQVGPIEIIRRSWVLTAGHWWHLFGFLVIFFIGAIVLLIAVGAAAGVAAQLLLGSIKPMSPGALLVALVGALANAIITSLFAVMLARIYAQLAGRDAARATVPKSGT
jgi:hypothetical protein